VTTIQSPDHRSQRAVPTPDEATTYASLSKLVYADRPLADTLERVSVLASRALSETPEVSLTLLEGERAWTAATSGPVALQLDNKQYDTGSGPCLDAALYGETVKVTMNSADQPYSDFRQAAQREGVTHTMSIGLSTGDQVMGAMNIYNSTGRPLSEDSDRIARTIAVCAGIVLANLERYRQTAVRAAHLEVALQSRAPIEQAKGILMTRHGCTSDDAFEMLIGLSQTQNVKLRIIAQDLVDQATPGRSG
jgi:transcriptional regulator with GAF, ATPase, and Fis domain